MLLTLASDSNESSHFLVRASPFLCFGKFAFIFPLYLGQLLLVSHRWGMEETALKRVLWELSHGAPGPSLGEGLRPSADFHPCLVYFTLFSVLFLFVLCYFWFCYFGLSLSLCWILLFIFVLKSLNSWYSGTLVLVSNPNSSSIHVACSSITMFEAGVCIYIYIFRIIAFYFYS